MKKVSFLFLFFLSSVSNAQLDYGFVGKKNLVSLYINPSVNFFHHLQEEPLIFGAPNSGNSVFDFFRICPKFSYSRLLKERVAIGLELGFRQSRVIRYPNYSVYFNTFFSSEEFFKIYPVYNTVSIVPNISFGLNRLNGSMGFKGLSFQVGIGMVMHKLDKKSTRFDASFTDDLEELLLNQSDKVYVGMNCFIQAQNRFLVANGLFLDFGVRGNINLMLGDKEFKSEVLGYSEPIARRGLSRIGISQILSFKLGLAYQF